MIITDNMPETDLADAALVTASLAGDREAFGLIVTRYQSLVCSLAFSATGSLTQSEDLAQETFVAAWKSLGDLREPGKLRSWLCRIARNRICDAFRGEKRELSHGAETLDLVDQAPAMEPLPPDQAISKEEEAILWHAIERIPEIYREPLALFYRQHQAIASVAQSLELSEDAVKQRLSRGRKMLHEQVTAFVEGALEKTSPGKMFTPGVLAGLPLTATSAKSAALGSAMAAAGTGAKTAATAGAFGGFFPPLMGVLGLCHNLKSEIEDTDSPRERQLAVGMVWIRVAFIMVYLALLYFCMRHLDIARHPFEFEAVMAAFPFGVALFVVASFSYADRRRRQITTEDDPSAETKRRDGLLAKPIRKASRRKVYLGVAAGMAFPLAWLVVSAARAMRTGLWLTALGTLVVCGMLFFLGVRSWQRFPWHFLKLDFGKVVQIVVLTGVIALLNLNLDHYVHGIVDMDRGTAVIGRWGLVGFNVVIVLVYGAFVGALLWKRKIELGPRSL